jgi:hypothetical protein
MGSLSSVSQLPTCAGHCWTRVDGGVWPDIGTQHPYVRGPVDAGWSQASLSASQLPTCAGLCWTRVDGGVWPDIGTQHPYGRGPVDAGWSQASLSADPAYAARLEELRQYLSLQEDWDGYGAVAPGAIAVHHAMTLLSNALDSHLPTPRVMLSSCGTVGLYWRLPGIYAEMGMDGDGTFYWFAEGVDAPESSEAVAITDGLPKDLIDFLST